LWLPVIPMQIGLLLKPGPQEPWTPYRMAAAFTMAGVPKEAIGIYPGLGDVGAEVVRRCGRTMIFGGTATVERYKGDPRVQVHGPGFSKILLGDDVVDQWEKYLDIMADSVFLNSGRGCINCSAYGPHATPRKSLRRWPSDSGQWSQSRPKTRRPVWRRSQYLARPRPSGTASKVDSAREVSSTLRPSLALAWWRRSTAVTFGQSSFTATRRNRP